jgi:hypothetical protein
VRIGEANDLAGVAGVGENFLITGEAGIKNNFAAAARDSASRAAMKYAPVFEREYGGSGMSVRQWNLRRAKLFVVGFGSGQGTEVVNRPISKDRTTVNKLAGNWTEHARIVGTNAMVTHNEVAVGRDLGRGIVADVGVLRRDVRLRNLATVDVDHAVADFDGLSGQGNHALDKGFGTIERIPENDDIAAIDRLEAVHEFVDEDALLIGKERGHAGAFDFYGLVKEDDDDQSKTDGDQKVAGPDANFVTKQLVRGRRSGNFR